VFGITIGNHAAAVDSAKKHGAIRQLAGQGLADIIAKLDEGLDINTGGFRGGGCSCSVPASQSVMYRTDIIARLTRAGTSTQVGLRVEIAVAV
jgi:hypothetical protein